MATPRQKATVERLAAFSDAVFAVIITIMVLDLKPPEHPTFAALVPLWPTALSYVVSYSFIAIVWVNHHHLLRLDRLSVATTDLDQFRTFVYGVAGTIRDRMGCAHAFGRGPCVCICRC